MIPAAADLEFRSGQLMSL